MTVWLTAEAAAKYATVSEWKRIQAGLLGGPGKTSKGGRYARRPPYRGPAVVHDKLHPLPTSFVKVHPESPEAIAAMPSLTETQQALWNRVQTEGEVIFSGPTAKKTVEALAKGALVDYDAEYALNEKHLYCAYRFTVRLKPISLTSKDKQPRDTPGTRTNRFGRNGSGEGKRHL